MLWLVWCVVAGVVCCGWCSVLWLVWCVVTGVVVLAGVVGGVLKCQKLICLIRDRLEERLMSG